ncbi:MAG TPA: DUF6279 family lipoprotein [Ramlibacter sp.]|nr:DUF6279 family lipoprotein [Ramlibacter sp.]
MTFTTVAFFARIIGLLALALSLAACSAVKLGYNNLPEVTYWWLDGYVDFEDGQDQRVREDLARLHTWHRGAELPRYGELLQRMERLAAKDLVPAQVCAFEPDLRERFQVLADRAEPPVVTMALSLTPAQLQHLERKYAKNNAEYRRDWLRLTPAELTDKRVKQLLERFEMVYGNLGDAQRAALRQQVERSPFDAQRVLAERQRRQRDTLETLRKVTGGAPLDEARALMRGLFERTLKSPDPAYRAYQEAAVQAFCSTVAVVHNSTTAVQRENAVRRLRAYQRDVGELTAVR